MKDSTKLILVGGISFLLGGAAGGAGVYFYTKRYFAEKFEAEKQELGEYYISKYAPEKEEKDESIGEEKGDGKEPSKEAGIQGKYEAISDIYKSKTDESDRTNTSYSGYYDGNTGSDNSGKKKGGKKKKKVDLEIVDQEVWDENPGNFDTKFLVYYDVDRVLIDEESDKIFEDGYDDKDLPKVIESGEPDENSILIIQSNFTNILYHVTVERMAFSEIGPDD